MNESVAEETVRSWDDPGVNPGRSQPIPVLLTFAVYAAGLALLIAYGVGVGTALVIAVVAGVLAMTTGRRDQSIAPARDRVSVKVNTPLHEFPPGRTWVALRHDRLMFQSRPTWVARLVVLPLLVLLGPLICFGVISPFGVLWVLGGGMGVGPQPAYPPWAIPLGVVIGLWLTAAAVHTTSTRARLVLPLTWIESSRRDGRTVVVMVHLRDGLHPLTIRGEPRVLQGVLRRLHAAGVRVDPGKSPIELHSLG